MPSIIRSTTETFRSASSLPEPAIRVLREDQRNSNIILPYILKARTVEHDGDNIWIVSSTTQANGESKIDFIAAVTQGPIDSFPLFIYHTRPLEVLTLDFMKPRMEGLARALVEAGVTPRRIFSVFAVEPVSRAFVNAWTDLTGVRVDPGDEKVSAEYYAALLTYCDRRSFRPRALTVHPSMQFYIRQATMTDLEAVASLCYGFAAGSEPFVLTMEEAVTEASTYIAKGQIWVHEVVSNGSSGIASICAVTRTTAKVAGITKVYTNPQYRKMGCALRLVRAVCQHYLIKQGKECLVLYVAHDNEAARRTYHQVGFRGLDGKSVAGVEPWLEIGFDRAAVNLGHW